MSRFTDNCARYDEWVKQGKVGRFIALDVPGPRATDMEYEREEFKQARMMAAREDKPVPSKRLQ